MKFVVDIWNRPVLSTVLGGAVVPALLVALPIAGIAGVTQSTLEGGRYPGAASA